MEADVFEKWVKKLGSGLELGDTFDARFLSFLSNLNSRFFNGIKELIRDEGRTRNSNSENSCHFLGQK